MLGREPAQQHRDLPVLHQLVGEPGVAARNLLGDEGEGAHFGGAFQLHAAVFLGHGERADADTVGLLEDRARQALLRLHQPLALPVLSDERRDEVVDEGAAALAHDLLLVGQIAFLESAHGRSIVDDAGSFLACAGRMRAIPLIVNSRSGTGADGVVERLAGLYRAAGAEASPRVAKSGADLPTLAREVARDQPPLIVAAGGDGTINAVASALVGSSTSLGVIPCGTLNHFARDLGIPLDQTEAVLATLRGRAREIDVGEVNGRFFLNNSSI